MILAARIENRHSQDVSAYEEAHSDGEAT
jgi:hypothetical protein